MRTWRHDLPNYGSITLFFAMLVMNAFSIFWHRTRQLSSRHFIYKGRQNLGTCIPESIALSKFPEFFERAHEVPAEYWRCFNWLLISIPPSSNPSLFPHISLANLSQNQISIPFPLINKDCTWLFYGALTTILTSSKISSNFPTALREVIYHLSILCEAMVLPSKTNRLERKINYTLQV